jgi:hypothetical protein
MKENEDSRVVVYELVFEGKAPEAENHKTEITFRAQKEMERGQQGTGWINDPMF